MRKTFLIAAVTAIAVSGITFTALFHLFPPAQKIAQVIQSADTTAPVREVAYTLGQGNEIMPLDFTKPAAKVMDAVVHIKSSQMVKRMDTRNMPSPFDFFFGPSPRNPQGQDAPMREDMQVGSGSGVIISQEGYIVTNNHVIADAEDIEVTLYDNRTFKASVVGTDPTTDIALLKIEETQLPALQMANSDEVKVGEWVLAVGNPFNLNSTVTAGIVSAKARNINILRSQEYAIESFIQTDAAINPGNSGGALVNLEGDLIGINTAIASPTGSYSGYGFAVPANLVKKVLEDLRKYGAVQRGYLGVMIRNLDANLAREKGIDINQGVYVDELLENGAGEKAGVKAGDVILKVGNATVNTSPELQEQIARYRPGDKVQITVYRDGREKQLEAILKNRDGETDLIAKEKVEVLSGLGADFETVDKETAEKLKIDGGVKVKNLFPGKLRKDTQMAPGFIITKVDGRKVTSVEDLAAALENKKGGVLMEGLYEDGRGIQYYGFGM